MSVLEGKKVVLGITAGIAAYKTAYLVREFIKAGAQVKVVMTPEAKQFVTPLTLSTLSKNEVISNFTSEENENETWNNHVEIGLWADLMLIAPATANTLSKMAGGTSDNILLAAYLSAKCPVYFAPAMDLDMYQHPSTKNNISTLQEFGNILIPAESGELASGLNGEGRMAEPENIIRFIENDILQNLPLTDKKILITAGPTYEEIDPVRFIGNHSSGKMGFELAQVAASLGAQVTLISGPTHLNIENSRVKLIKITNAREMLKEAELAFENTDIVIAAAAVADYRPAHPASHKIKKKEDHLTLELVKNPDILAILGARRTNQIIIGFALETENAEENARAKLEKKNLNFIVLNSLEDEGAGFKKETNKVSLIFRDRIKTFETKSKKEVAIDILNEIINLLEVRR